MGQPIGQRDIGVVGTSEDFEVVQVGVTDILDIVTDIAFDVTNVPGIEV
jgi:hypothetical protein